MLTTKNLVMLNFPKTGSSFARSVVWEMHRRRLPNFLRFSDRLVGILTSARQLKNPKIFERHGHGLVEQHGVYVQIPPSDAHKDVVSVIRNPIGKFLSGYRFRWWAKYPPAPVEDIIREFPAFPNLTFEEYYRMAHVYEKWNRLGDHAEEYPIGSYTAQFIHFFCVDPLETLEQIRSGVNATAAVQNGLADVTFLRQEHLNEDLKQFLSAHGYSDKELKLIDEMGKVNETVSVVQDDPDKVISSEMSALIRERERVIFDLFPDYKSMG